MIDVFGIKEEVKCMMEVGEQLLWIFVTMCCFSGCYFGAREMAKRRKRKAEEKQRKDKDRKKASEDAKQTQAKTKASRGQAGDDNEAVELKEHEANMPEKKAARKVRK